MKYRKNVKAAKICLFGLWMSAFYKKGTTIDQEKAEKMIYAIDNGVNYFDTAYIYPGSEVALANCCKGYRNKVYMTKLPITSSKPKIWFFQEQLSGCKRIISIIILCICFRYRVWQRLISLGIIDWIGKSLGANTPYRCFLSRRNPKLYRAC